MGWQDLVDDVHEAVIDADHGMGREGTYTSPDGLQVDEFQGVFDENHAVADADLGLTVNVSTTSPMIGVRASQFTAPPVPKGRITLDEYPGKIWRIRDVQPAEPGWLKLELVESA